MPASDDDLELEIEDPRNDGPVQQNLDQEQLDLFHDLLFGLEWKRISAVLWIFRGVSREQVAEVMDTSRANIDALYKRAKDQMTERYAEGSCSPAPRELDVAVLTPGVRASLRELLPVPLRQLHAALLRPAAKRQAVLGLVLVEYAHFRCSLAELGRLCDAQDVPGACEALLTDLARRVLT